MRASQRREEIERKELELHERNIKRTFPVANALCEFLVEAERCGLPGARHCVEELLNFMAMLMGTAPRYWPSDYTHTEAVQIMNQFPTPSEVDQLGSETHTSNP